MARRGETRAQECADPDPHRDRPHRRPADLGCHCHRNRLRSAWRRQSHRLGGVAPRLSPDPGGAAGRRRALRPRQFYYRHALSHRRSPGALLMAAIAQSGFREPNLLMKMASRPTAMAGLLIIIAMIVLALLAPVISPY